MRHVLTVLCLVAAGAFYAVGAGRGVAAFIVAGMVCEAAFWLRVLPRPAAWSDTASPVAQRDWPSQRRVG